MKILDKKAIQEINKSQIADIELILILENIQYATNVAGIFRTAEAVGIKKIFLTGSSQKPPFGKDLQKASRKKEAIVSWEYCWDTLKIIAGLQSDGYQIIALEFTDQSVSLPDFCQGAISPKIAVIAGNEVSGITKATLEMVKNSVYIPMFGKGSSLNVAASVAITLFSLVLFNFQKK
ncbi:MAG: TrmH family RNA methyltransferase [bacterium]